MDIEVGYEYPSVRKSLYNMNKSTIGNDQAVRREGQLRMEEKKFLLVVERGDVASVRRYLQTAKETGNIDVNCVDPLGRSALLMAIENENLEMVELLLEFKVETKDGLLHAISEEYVEAVELLLDHEDAIHKPGEPYSWEAIDRDTATFTPDITPLCLAAHRDNYEILKILLDRGAKFPVPHDARCGCKTCMESSLEDSLRHSRSRINAYRALAAPSMIALSSKDPILTAFELSWELRRLSFMEHEFKSEYQELRRQCQNFATALLDHTRTTYELEVLLNYDPSGPAFEHGDRMNLSRLKLAIKYKQKKFCAHSNVQQLLASLWYEGLPGFRRKNVVLQSLEIFRIGTLFPVYSIAYILSPHSSYGRIIRRPFIKFICHSASYITFLFLLILASQRIETVLTDLFGSEEAKRRMRSEVTTKRGAPPSVVEWMILAWVLGLIWSEIKQLWDYGLIEYVNDMWNIIDFITNSLYVATVALRIVAYFQVQKEIALKTGTAFLPRERWDAWDPILISEGLFAAANIFSSLKLVYIFSVNPHLGPLQISLGRMVIDILKFLFVYTLVLFAFACGLNQLLWYYAEMERQACNKSLPSHYKKSDSGSCLTWRRFANLFESSQTLFWASFGLIDLDNFELTGIKSYTRFWGMLMFGCYSVINIVVLLNLLIAMMNHSYQMISEQADTEWKFARSKLWMSYFEDGGTVPPPFNIIPTPKSIYYLFRWMFRKFCGHSRSAKIEHLKTIRRKAKQANERDIRYQTIMRNLVRRYVTKEQRKADNQGVTEDDVNEIKQDISSFRYELIEILKNSGFNTSSAKDQKKGGGGKKGRQKERRLMKGFNIGLVEGSLPTIHGLNLSNKSAVNRITRLARMSSDKRHVKQGKWKNFMDATRSARAAFTRSRSEESISSQGSSGQQSHIEISSESSVSVMFTPEYESEEEVKPAHSHDHRPSRTATSDMQIEAKRLSRLSRKFGSLSFNPSKLRLVFQDHNKFTPRVQSVPKLSGFSEKKQAERTISAPSSKTIAVPAKSEPKTSEEGKRSSTTLSLTSANVSVERNLSPIQSYADSNPNTPKTSLTRICETSVLQECFSEVGTTPYDKGTTLNERQNDQQTQTTKSTTSNVQIRQNNIDVSPSIENNDTSPTELVSSKTLNGSIGIMSRVYGIEPANKQMSLGWI
ncbi:transient receptor potential-gamma protein-like [Tachypleus tridentatus]|uniref:transient receptor potential-gamma protein-like n=1 Tax=Tachypleus tridentatus TaxID=6853 RepID=UPI003FD50E2C